MTRRRTAALLVALVALASCATYDPRLLDRSRGFGGKPVAKVDVGDVPVHGFPAVVVVRDGPDLEGELLAVGGDRIYVFSENDKRVVTSPWSGVREVRITVAPSRPGEPGGSIVWTVLGTLSTLSHGYYLIITGPIWLLFGIPVSAANTNSVAVEVKADEFHRSLYQFARFPQGPPPWLTGEPVATPAAPVRASIDAGLEPVDAGDDAS
jgi:hypothetical protein